MAPIPALRVRPSQELVNPLAEIGCSQRYGNPPWFVPAVLV